MTSGFPEEIAPIRLDLPTFGAPAKTANGFSIINVCHRAFPRSIVPSREAVGRKLQGDKLETLAKKYLYDLRQAAFIESRI